MKNLIIKTLVVAGMTFFLASVASAQEKVNVGEPQVCPVRKVKNASNDKGFITVQNEKIKQVNQDELIVRPVRKFAPAIRRQEQVALPVEK